jgi:hypothetical protein
MGELKIPTAISSHSNMNTNNKIMKQMNLVFKVTFHKMMPSITVKSKEKNNNATAKSNTSQFTSEVKCMAMKGTLNKNKMAIRYPHLLVVGLTK